MVTLLLGKDWKANSDHILSMIADDVSHKKGNIILLVPELISHDMERRLCFAAGDTVSRFAEVLSFPRLLKRVADAIGEAVPECMDEGGRLIAMAAATHQLHSRLKAYAAVETRPEFLSGMVDALDEFKRCCITPSALSEAALKAEGSLAQKLEELGLIYAAYDGICARGSRDPRDQMSWLLDQLEGCDFAENHTLYIDGFPDFTRQHLQIIEHFIRHCPNVVISLNCDIVGSKKIVFEKAGETAKDIMLAAKESGIPYEIKYMPAPVDDLSILSQRLFQGPTDKMDVDGRVHLYSADSPIDECVAAARYIRQLVRSGVRYRDIGVVCCNLESYKHHINSIFQRSDIPAYLSGTEDILSKSVIHTVIAALEAVSSNFRQKDVLAYLKSAISPISLHDCDLLENYAVVWSINGKGWSDTWSKHPNGLSDQWSDKDRERLAKLNDLRSKAIDPLERLRVAMQKAENLSAQVNALAAFMQETSLAPRLNALAMHLDSQGDNRSAQIMNQLWDILLNALDQMQDLLSETVWQTEAFLRLFKLLLSRYNVGTIPSMLDAVTVGSVSAMRCQRVKHLLVLGAVEGSMPSYASIGGVLSEQERNALRKLGVPLTGGALDGLNIEFSEVYGVFCGADESIYVSYPSGQPCFAFQRLERMVSLAEKISKDHLTFFADDVEAGAYLAARGLEDTAQALHLDEEYQLIQSAREHVIGNMEPNVAIQLYGDTVPFSATKTDTYGKCRLSYFLRYGVKAKVRKPAEVDPAEFGTFVHAVMEELGIQILQLGGFKEVSLEQTLLMAEKIAQDYITKHFGQIESQRTAYLLKKNGKQLAFIVTDWWEEMQTSQFQPVGFELSFGDGKIFDAIEICGKNLRAKLEGFVDRVDMWQQDGRVYFRVVDYKTGKKAFDYCDVFNGMGMQMLLYLFALEQNGQSLLGDHPVPAGVLYVPARADYISAQSDLDDEVAASERVKLQRRSGLLLDDDAALNAMEPIDAAPKLPVKRDKEGNFKGDMASGAQLKLLKRYITLVLERMADDIAGGKADANPYTRGNNFDACAYCDYNLVCCGKNLENRRDYRSITSDEFWQYVEKELSDHGR